MLVNNVVVCVLESVTLQSCEKFPVSEFICCEILSRLCSFGILDNLDSVQLVSFIIIGKYVGNRPIKLRKSNWKDRNVEVVKKKEKEKKKLGFR